MHELTGLPVAIADRHGNLTAWAGPGQPDPYPKPTAARREHPLEAGSPVRDRGRLIALALQGHEVLGVIALVDPNRTAGDAERIALEHGNTVLTLGLAHLQALRGRAAPAARPCRGAAGRHGRPERPRPSPGLGLRPGPPPSSGCRHQRARGVEPEKFFHAVRRAVRATEVGSLLVTRWGRVAVLCDADQDWEQLRGSITAELGPRSSCRIGMGELCTEPPEFPRSHEQAQLASPRIPGGVV